MVPLASAEVLMDEKSLLKALDAMKTDLVQVLSSERMLHWLGEGDE